MNNNNNEDKVIYLRLDDIMPNRFQPREVFDETGLEELADSIKEHGVIQPIIVRQMGDKYELIAGERRSKASALAGLTTIPAIVRNMDDRESAKVSLLENLQRKNLSAIEEARTYKRILELDNMTQEDLAKTMGKSQPLIANKLRLLSLPEEVQDALIKNQISERHARSLLNVKDKENQLMLLDRIRNERLTVRELDVEIKRMNGNIPPINNSDDNNQSSGDGRLAYNTFNQANNIPPFSDNTRTNFGSMGLNDYQSSVNNNMFNNIPTEFQTSNDQFSNQFNNILDVNNTFNPNPLDSQTGYNEFNNFDNNMNNNLDNNINNNLNNNMNNDMNNNFTSLGSMFDGGNGTNMPTDLSRNENSDNQNIFMSHIKEDEIKTQGNQFLPNFDDMPFEDTTVLQNNILVNQMDFQDQNNNQFANSFDNSSNFNQFNNTNNQNFNEMNNYNDLGINNNFNNNNNFDMNNNVNSNNNFTDFNNPTTNFDSTYQENQGDLFNQPLNIVSVPNNNFNQDAYTEDNYNQEFTNQDTFGTNQINDMNSNFETYNDFNQTENQLETEEKFDNPLDDPYENILFAKPVPIQMDNNLPSDEVNQIDSNTGGNINNQTTDNPDEVEVIGASEDNQVSDNTIENNQEQNNKNDYITLDPVKTIFDTRGAVLELKKTTDAIKQNNIKIETEEIDFDDYYQIIIKVKKD